MQLVCAFDINPEEYVADEMHRRVEAPSKCPNCYRKKALLALGYYGRNLSRVGVGVLVILIRRFRCRHCRKTASILPSFAQPYRFVQNRTIQRFFSGAPFSDEVIRHADLLAQYWRRFGVFLPHVRRAVGKEMERAPPGQPRAAWRVLVSLYEDLGSVTQNLVAAHQITPFGRYRCHRPNSQKGDTD
jgi:Domain of unknown function (DUF6431)